MTDVLELEHSYESLKSSAEQDLKGKEVSRLLFEISRIGHKFLSTKCEKTALACDVPGKNYFSFHERGKTKLSRPVNQQLFDQKLCAQYGQSVLSCTNGSLKAGILDKILYSLALAYCCPIDLTKNNDKKSPGTYFEILIGHLVARRFGVNPYREIEVLNLDLSDKLPTDFVFDLGNDKNRIHLPIKTSTRERVIQVWAHQRVLDGIYGVGRFKGILVCLAETNAKSNYRVTEVCLPGQWRIYQMFIAQLHRIYYLDLPDKYRDMGSKYPFIQTKPFSSFFFEADTLAKASPLS